MNYFWGIFHFFFTWRFWCWHNFMECDTFEVFLAQKHLIFFLQIISLYKTGLKVFQGPILQRFLSQVLGILTSKHMLAHVFYCHPSQTIVYLIKLYSWFFYVTASSHVFTQQLISEFFFIQWSCLWIGPSKTFFS